MKDNNWKYKKYPAFTFVLFFSIIAVGIPTYLIDGAPATGVAAGSRMINSFFSALLTSMALIITLTANLYSPRLAKIFVKNPLTIVGLGHILITNLTFLIGPMFASTKYSNLIHTIQITLSVMALVGTAPFLYFVSYFLQPKYFVPLLEKQAIKNLKKIHQSNSQVKKKKIFDEFDVISNIITTASKRDDKQLMRDGLKSVHEILLFLIENHSSPNKQWRMHGQIFLPGLSYEGQYYLEKEQIWPEAYILGKITRLATNLGNDKDEIISIICENLLETLEESIKQKRNNIISLHKMTLNSFLRDCINKGYIGRFQSLSYYYRLAIELLIDSNENMVFAIESYIHYGNIAFNNQMYNAKETVLFDISRIVIFIAYQNENLAIEIFTKYIGPALENDFSKDHEITNAAWRSITKTYWESVSKRCYKLADIIHNKYLSDDKKHIESLDYLFAQKYILHWELNDRLLSFANMSAGAKSAALEYYNASSSKVA